MEDLRDKAISLINHAKLVTDKKEKENILIQVQEICLNRDPLLLEELLIEIINFKIDNTASIRKFVISFLEEVCKKNTKYTEQYIIPTFIHFLHDENENVIKKVILACNNIHRYILQYVSNNITNESKKLWDLYNMELKREIYALGHSSVCENVSISLAIIKYMETLIFSYSRPGSNNDNSTTNNNDNNINNNHNHQHNHHDRYDFFTTANVPTGHPHLNVELLEKEGESYLSELISWLEQGGIINNNSNNKEEEDEEDMQKIVIVKEFNPSQYNQCINSITAIASHRPRFFSAIADIITSLLKPAVDNNNNDNNNNKDIKRTNSLVAKSVVKVLQSSGLKLLKLPISTKVKTSADELSLTLSKQHGMGEDVLKILEDSKKRPYETMLSQPANKRMLNKDLRLSSSSQQQQQQQLQQSTTGQMLMYGGKVSSIVTGLDNNNVHINKGHGKVNVPFFASSTTTMNNQQLGMDIEKLPIARDGIMMIGGKDDMNSIDQQQMQQQQQQQMKKTKLSDHKEQGMAALKRVIDAEKKATIYGRVDTACMIVTRLGCVLSGEFIQAECNKLKESQKKTGDVDDTSTMITENIIIPEPIDYIFDYVMEDYPSRSKIMEALLYEYYTRYCLTAQSETNNNNNNNNTDGGNEETTISPLKNSLEQSLMLAVYDQLVLRLFNNLFEGGWLSVDLNHREPKMNSDEKCQCKMCMCNENFARTIAIVPRLPNVALESIGKAIKEGNTGGWIKQGLNLLLELIMTRESVRELCVNMVLSFTNHPESSIRTMAVTKAASELWPKDQFRELVEAHAMNSLKSCETLELIRNDSQQAASTGGENSENIVDANGKEVTNTTTTTTSEDKEKKEALTLMQLEIRSKLSLYLSLCARDKDHFLGVFNTYKESAEQTRKVLYHQLDDLAKYIISEYGAPAMIDSMASIPDESFPLLIRFLEVAVILAKTMEDDVKDAMVESVRGLYKKKGGGLKLVLPVLGLMQAKDIHELLPTILQNMNEDEQMDAFKKIGRKGGTMSAADLLIALHHVEGTKILLDKVKSAIKLCVMDHNFKDQSHNDTLKDAFDRMLVEEIKHIPALYMRTLIIAAQANPTIKEFAYSQLIPRLVDGQIWTSKSLWRGFKILVKQVSPEGAIPSLLALPVRHLTDLLTEVKVAKEPLSIYLADLPDRDKIPLDVRNILGLID